MKLSNDPSGARGHTAALLSVQCSILEFYETVKNKLVLGENISQAAQFVQSEAAEIGIVALSLALSDPMRASGKYWQVPFDAYPRMDQAGVILKHARSSGNLDAARAFVNALQSPSGRAVLGRYGFSLLTAVR